MKRADKSAVWIFAATVFFGMLLFFTVLHPIPIMDEDDVIYAVLVRKAVPVPGSWNPARMMPEVLTSFCGSFAAILTRLGCGTFIHCQVATVGFVLSVFITGYVAAFRRMLVNRMRVGTFQSICLSALFLELHFLAYRVTLQGNLHMFHTYDECCVFFYTIPALLSSTLVMFLISEDTDNPLQGKGILYQSALVTGLYFAVFSNLYGSIILAAYAGVMLLCHVLKRNPKGWKHFFRTHIFLIILLAVWLLALVLEGTGGRAAGLNSEENNLIQLIGDASSAFWETIWNTNFVFKTLLLCAGILSIILAAIHRNSNEIQSFGNLTALMAAIGAVCTVFIILLNAVVNPDYSGRPEVIYVAMFAVIAITCLCIAFVLQRVPSLATLLPILLIFVFSMTNTRQSTFADSNPVNINGKAAVKLENEIYETIVAAALDGKKEIGVSVPKYNEASNWPHDGNIGAPIAQLFFKFGIIDHEMTVWTVPDEALNEEYGIKP